MAKKSNLTYWAITVAVAGFLFGFDTVVISGANQPIKELWNTSPAFHGTFIMSMALWGTVLGSLLGGYPIDVFGRKKTLFWIGILFLVSALGSAFAWDPYSFSFFRFIGGVGVGASSVAAPAYISELSPENRRGRLVALYQFMIVFGIFIAFFSNYLLDGIGGANDWRWMLGVEAVPAAIYCLLILGVPQSPRWLVLKKGDDATAASILSSIEIEDPEAAIAEIKKSVSQKVKASLWDSRYKKVLWLSFALAFFNQLSGINFVLYYAPEILERAGLASQDSLMSSIAIGGVNLLFTMLGMYLIDRVGRRTLMIIGSIGYIIGLSMVALAFQQGLSSAILLTFILVFIASHAVGQGAVIWVFISEIFPNKVRSFGQSWGTGVHWILAAVITLVTPIFLDGTDGIFKDNPYPIFWFFAGFMVLQLLWTLFVMPETKGRSLEELEQELISE